MLSGLARRGDFVLDVTVEVAPGEVLGVLGPNGAGKTTLLRTVAGLEHLEQGSVVVAGRVWQDQDTDLPPEERAAGVVFQDYRLFPHLDVRDNIAFAERARGTGRAAGAGTGRAVARATGPRLARPAATRAALGRPGATGRTGARPRDRSRGPAARRADGSPRRGGADRGPCLPPPPPHRLRGSHGPGHPRPPRGDGAGRPAARHRGRAHRPGRHPTGGGPPARLAVRREAGGAEPLVRHPPGRGSCGPRPAAGGST